MSSQDSELDVASVQEPLPSLQSLANEDSGIDLVIPAECSVCLCGIEEGESNTSAGWECPSSKLHQVCKDCMHSYILSKMQSRDTLITCPSLNCASHVPLDTIRRVLGEASSDLLSFEKMKALNDNPLLRECPQCSHLNPGDPTEPSMKCAVASCGREYCFHHGETRIVSFSYR